MSDLQRHLAPIPDGVWDEIDEEAGRVLRLHLAGRKLVDFEGPKGWTFSALALG
ncbi:MAG: family 1 encapsulin nanocompartment shell protein, partial [Myxococcota bacterium]|nr:family 1 encapsulin nanocompartment shell protein [Myxococcota bacterium]